MAWSTTSKKGPRKDDPRESCLLADPDWEPTGKAEEVDIGDGPRALSLALKLLSSMKKSSALIYFAKRTQSA